MRRRLLARWSQKHQTRLGLAVLTVVAGATALAPFSQATPAQNPGVHASAQHHTHAGPDRRSR